MWTKRPACRIGASPSRRAGRSISRAKTRPTKITGAPRRTLARRFGLGAQMFDELPRVERQLGEFPDANCQIAHSPGIAERHSRNLHGLCDATRGRLRHNADADPAFDHPAHRVE